ncbi:MAG: hypothetical protein ACE5EQ_07375, partial [Phycisphaerae bacterium]
FKKADLQKPIRELSKKDIPEIASVEDITPTILTIVGIPVGRDMDGSTLSHLFKPEIAKIMKVAEIETHTTGEWLSSRGIEQRTIPGSEERMNQLRSLGYLGGSDDEQPSQTNLNKPSSQPSDSQ